MTRPEAQEKAYRLLVVSMPPTWMEKTGTNGVNKLTPKAIKLRNFLAEELMKAYHAGLQQRMGERK